MLVSIFLYTRICRCVSNRPVAADMIARAIGGARDV